MLIKLFPENPNEKMINSIVELLQKGGVIIYPTDTVYAMGCDTRSYKGVEKICKLKGIAPQTANLSFLCTGITEASQYCRVIPNNIFKVMKRNLPGPFTFILEANSSIPKLLKNKRKTIGIRIPDNSIVKALVTALGNPILSTSIHDVDQSVEYSTDPELIHERFGEIVDLIIDGGIGGLEASTVVDCSTGEINIIRKGKGLLLE